jgi:hypothetical protein
VRLVDDSCGVEELCTVMRIVGMSVEDCLVVDTFEIIFFDFTRCGGEAMG